LPGFSGTHNSPSREAPHDVKEYGGIFMDDRK